MPEIHNKTLHSFSSEDPLFPAKNLLETKVTKKWKCQDVGEKSCFVVFKLDKPRIISAIDIGNERSAFVEVRVANSKQDPPAFKEILLATSFMTIVEAKSESNPNRVRFFKVQALIESVAAQKWDLVKVICTQPFNSKLKYGLSFVTLHTPECIKKDDDSPEKAAPVAKADDSAGKKFGRFSLRNDSDSDSDQKDKKESPFSRWKSSKSGSQESKPSIKEQMKSKLEDNRKRIRLLPDSSDDEGDTKVKSKPNRNRTTGLVYLDEDDEPNEKMQKKLDKDKDKQSKEKEHKAKRDKTPPKSDSSKSKFASFVNHDVPSTSSPSSRNKSPSRSSSKSSHSSSRDKKSSPKKSSQSEKDRKSTSSSQGDRHKRPSSSFQGDRDKPTTSSSSHKKSSQSPPTAVTYKPFHKLLEGVVFAFSGYVNPERGTLRQKALDMGAKYRPDWDRTCTHLICAFGNTPKYTQVKGVGKIVTKRWIETCFSDQKKLPWRRFAFDREDKDEPESESEVHNELLKPKTSPKRRISESGSDDDVVVVDKRVKNGDAGKSDEPMEVEDDPVVVEESPSKTDKANVMDVSTDDDMGTSFNDPSTDNAETMNQVLKGKLLYLHDDLPATEIIKLNSQIVNMSGKVTDRASKADYVITQSARRLPDGITGETLTSRWVFECYDLEAFIPTTRYKPKAV